MLEPVAGDEAVPGAAAPGVASRWEAPGMGVNVEQTRAWDGPSGDFWVANAARFDRGISRYQPLLVAAAAPGFADRVIDVGCGNGRLTLDMARRAHSALGVDLSAGMLRLARERAAAAGVARARFLRADVQVHPLPPADLVVSRNGVMFFDDPAAAFGNLARALRPGGRLVLLAWQPHDRQEWLPTFQRILSGGRAVSLPDAPMWSFGAPDRVAALLGGAGFVDVESRSVTEPMVVGTDVADAVDYVTGMQRELLAELDPAERAEAVAALREDAAAHLTDEGVLYGAACWIVRARRPETG
ncbi:class I SAM-dependent methyltransferase [Pseudonocardia xishanensis]|uniref:Class I SAM-dependent methyltransferase n=1 Tax=Pseudonocardia xishanensis TaxID=630995 RepID=A0ABP8S441_9PSEU